MRHGRLFANVIYNTSNAGDTYQLRTGEPIVDNSRVLAAQLRHRTQVATRHDLLYGVDFRQTIPRTGGTIHGRNEDDDELSEIGAYVHSISGLSPKVDLVGALRLDYHDRINDLAISPRVALVFKPSPSHALRLTYNRAYNSPNPQDLFIDLVVDSVPGLPYDMGLVPDGDTAPKGRTQQMKKDASGAVVKGGPGDRIVDHAWAATEWTLWRAMCTRRFWWLMLAFNTSLYAWYAVHLPDSRPTR